MQVLTSSSHLSTRQRYMYLLSELISRILHPTTLFLALQLAEGDFCNTWRTRIQHHNKTEWNEQIALLEMEGFPFPFCNILFSAFPSALQLCRSPTPSLVLTPALVWVESKLVQFTTPAELKKPQQKTTTKRPNTPCHTVWKTSQNICGNIQQNGKEFKCFKLI